MHSAREADRQQERTLRKALGPSKHGTRKPRGTAGLFISCGAHWPKNELALGDGYFHVVVWKILQNLHCFLLNFPGLTSLGLWSIVHGSCLPGATNPLLVICHILAICRECFAAPGWPIFSLVCQQSLSLEEFLTTYLPRELLEKPTRVPVCSHVSDVGQTYSVVQRCA